MTRIAFCDDDAALLHQMQDFLEQYRTLRGVQLELAPYTKPMELLADIEAGVRFDVLFLDVLMPGINGSMLPGRFAGTTRRCRSSL